MRQVNLKGIRIEQRRTLKSGSLYFTIVMVLSSHGTQIKTLPPENLSYKRSNEDYVRIWLDLAKYILYLTSPRLSLELSVFSVFFLHLFPVSGGGSPPKCPRRAIPTCRRSSLGCIQQRSPLFDDLNIQTKAMNIFLTCLYLWNWEKERI